MEGDPGHQGLRPNRRSRDGGVRVVVIHSSPRVRGGFSKTLLQSEHVLSVETFRDDCHAIPKLLGSNAALIFREIRAGVDVNGSLRPMLASVPRPRIVGLLHPSAVEMLPEGFADGSDAILVLPVRRIQLRAEVLLVVGRHPPTDPPATKNVRAHPCRLRGKCPTLDRRQQEVMKWVARGKPDKQIADAIATSEATVKKLVREIRKMLRSENRAQAAQTWEHCTVCQRGPISSPTR